MWIDEGIAWVTVEKYYGQPAVRRETLQNLDLSARASYLEKY